MKMTTSKPFYVTLKLGAAIRFLKWVQSQDNTNDPTLSLNSCLISNCCGMPMHGNVKYMIRQLSGSVVSAVYLHYSSFMKLYIEEQFSTRWPAELNV